MIAAALTDIAGSSSVVDRGFVTYSNAAKMEMLGVSPETLDAFGAVSAQTAGEMAAGALARSQAGVAVAVTGIAGPGGGSVDKPVGLVWFGLAVEGREALVESRVFEDRGRGVYIREQTVMNALNMVLTALNVSLGWRLGGALVLPPRGEIGGSPEGGAVKLDDHFLAEAFGRAGGTAPPSALPGIPPHTGGDQTIAKLASLTRQYKISRRTHVRPEGGQTLASHKPCRRASRRLRRTCGRRGRTSSP